MSSNDGAADTPPRRRAGADERKEHGSGSQVYHCDYDAMRVKTRPSFVRRWNNIVVGFLWSLLHFYLTYNFMLQLVAADGKFTFVKQRLFLLAELALFWGLLYSAVYGVILFDSCMRFHVENFDSFPKMYSDHAVQEALMHSDFKKYSFIKHLYGAIFLAPLRLLACVLFFALCVVLIGIPLTLFGDRFKEPTRKYVATMFRYVTRISLWGIGISEVKSVYADGVTVDKPINVINNHIGVLDTLYILQNGSYSFVCKKALEHTFIIGEFIRLLKCITVDRECEKNRREAYRAIANRMKAIDQGHESVSLVVYPEGTTCKGSVLLPFKHGAFGALVPLQPLLMVLDYTYLDIAYDVFTWPWWTIHTCCSPASVRLIAYWLPAIQPPTAEELALKGEHQCVREYALYANRIMREAVVKLNPNADLEHIQKRDVVVSPSLRGKLTARLYGPVMQQHYEITDAELSKTEEVVYH
ncbi:hypothetical protein BOVATA_039730 [Babesia ovata]|uniref:Phospholipid/glycerol acyltransferase domain-containing protein n=1 Tax=Babesia ovata TaxID=189622 RepID=A0A2H6KHL5_9APIC|nr:uncharacterized protein BOVATA_039730 [Babesia ovata]GBE62480.1 hypothetical protein BOVATA_039730 [Babesia ovata]